MEQSISSLSNQCKIIENRIRTEKCKLKSMKDTIQRYKTNQAIVVETNKNEARKEEIQQCQDKMNLLKLEFGNLRDAIAEFEKEKADVISPTCEKKKRSLNVMSAEVDMWNCEIRKLEKQIQKVRDINLWMEDDNRRKLKECQENHNSQTEKASTDCVRMGRLRMEEENAKKDVESLKENLKKALKGIRTLEIDLKEVESRCRKKEENIEMNEYYYLALLDNTVLKRKKNCALLELQIEKAKLKLRELQTTLKSRAPEPAVPEMHEVCKSGEEEIEQYEMKIEELRLECGILCSAIVKIKRDKSDYLEAFTKKLEISQRKVCSEIVRMKDEIECTDDKIKNVKKVIHWSVHDFEKKYRELSQTPQLDQHKFVRFRVEEEEARKAVDILRDNLKKTQEQVEYLKATLATIQLQCDAEERKAEDILQALREMKRMEEMALNEEYKMYTM